MRRVIEDISIQYGLLASAVSTTADIANDENISGKIPMTI